MFSNPPTWLTHLQTLIRSKFRQPSPPTEEAPRRLGLALGGGGGKGSAHLGVLQVLEELHVPIDLMVGTSIGGAMAIFHAAGLSQSAIHAAFRNTELRRIAVPDPTRTGLIGQRRRYEVLHELLGDRTFDDLRIPCAVVAADLNYGEAVVIKDGSLVEAVLATTALPSLFPPVLRDDRVLVDGGIVNNVPVDVAHQLGADRVIAVELNDAVPGFTLLPIEAENPISRLLLAPQQFAIANRALSLLINHATHRHLREHPPALLLSPHVVDIPLLDTTNPERGQQAGVIAAREHAGRLLELRAWRTNSPPPTAAQLAAVYPTPEPLDEWPEELDHAADQPQPSNPVRDLSAWWDEVFGSGRAP